MYRLRFRITARAPLVLSTLSGDRNMVSTEKFIPGTTVLGVLASRFIAQKKEALKGQPAHENDAFYRWFLAGELKMGNAYILSQDEYGEHAHYPTPLSIEREKYGQAVYDRLFLEVELTTRLGDFCLLDEEFIRTQSVKTGVNFHHERDREKGRPRMIGETGVIFNYEAIAPGQIFEGSVLGDESDLKTLLRICGDKWTAFVGRSRNAQYGTAAFEFIDKEPIPIPNQIAWPEDENGQPAKFISMTLLSDLILYNEHGYPTTDVADLQAELEKQVGEVTIEKAFVRKNEVANFVGIWQLKKPSEVCFAAGSTFLLKADPENLERLIEIQQSGIGERTHEGFGRCVFGLQTQPELSLVDETKETAKKPDGDIPNIAREVLTKIAQDAIAERTEMDAIRKMRSFDRLPSNTLIAKLEAMVKSAESHNKFVADINKLRKLASEQLQRCVSSESNLLEFLGAFRLDESAFDQMKENGFDDRKLSEVRRIVEKSKFVLIRDFKELKLDNSEKLLLLQDLDFYFDPVDWKRFWDQPRNAILKPLCNEIGCQPEADEEFKRDLLECFFITFLSMMRKRKITEQEGNDG